MLLRLSVRQVLGPLGRLGDGLDHAVAAVQESSHVSGQEHSVYELAERPERRLVVEHVTHDRSVASPLEVVVVGEALEGSRHHVVAKVARTVEGGDARREPEGDPELARLPGDRLPEPNETGRHACDGAFALTRHRDGMQVDAAREIEDPLDRRLDDGLELEDWHLTRAAGRPLPWLDGAGDDVEERVRHGMTSREAVGKMWAARRELGAEVTRLELELSGDLTSAKPQPDTAKRCQHEKERRLEDHRLRGGEVTHNESACRLYPRLVVWLRIVRGIGRAFTGASELEKTRTD